MSPRHALAILPLLFASPAAADALLGRLIADARAQRIEDVRFTRTLDNDWNGKRRVTVERFDGARSGADRWTLVSVDGAPPTAKDLRRFAEQVASQDPPFYGRVADVLMGGAVRSVDSEGRTVYRVAKLPAAGALARFKDIADKVTAEATVGGPPDRPRVTAMRIFAPAPFRMRLVLRVDSFEARTTYAVAGDRPQVVAQTWDAKGRALGMTGYLKTRMTITPEPMTAAR